MSNCWTGCLDRGLCKSEDKGLFVEARYLQMTDLEIPYEIEQRNLRTLLLTEETAKETFMPSHFELQIKQRMSIDSILFPLLDNKKTCRFRLSTSMYCKTLDTILCM